MILKDAKDSIALCNISRYKIGYLSNSDMDQALDLVVKAGSEWCSIHYTPHRPSELARTIEFAQRAKLKGLKVHFRCHYTTDSGQSEFNYQTGVPTKTTSKATSGTINTITDNTKNWPIDQYKGFQCSITDGTNNGKTMYINSNTSNTLTLIAVGNYSAFPVACDNTSVYKITFKEVNDKAFTDPNIGWTKYVYDAAVAAKAIGVESFSVCNEITNTIIGGISGSNFQNGSGVVQAQKDLVAYIKSKGVIFPFGITTSDGFWMHDDWIASGSFAPLDYLGYTAYEPESRFFYTLKRLCDTFGANNIQLDEMSLSEDYLKAKRRLGIFNSDLEYANLLSRRVKYAKNLGVRNIFRFELLDDGAEGWPKAGFGYGQIKDYAPGNIFLNTWLVDSYNRVIDPRITNYSLGFRSGTKALQIPNSSALNLGGKLTIQFWCNLATADNAGNPTFIRKDTSYIIRIENKRLRAILWTSNGQFDIQDNTNYQTDYILNESGVAVYGDPSNREVKNNSTIPLDRWVHIAYVYDGTKHTLFVNGKNVATGNVTGTINNVNNPLAIGAEENNSNAIDGRIQDLEIVKDAVYTTSFIPSILKPNSPNTLIRLIMGEGTGSTIKDTSGNNIDFTITGSGLEKASWFPGLRDKLYYQEYRYGIVPPNSTKRYAIKNGSKAYIFKPTI
jgi:Concanavalin A-like lectin/glucanases superfamily